MPTSVASPSPSGSIERLPRGSAGKAAGLPCGVFIAPLLPYLTDTEEQIEALMAELAEAGVTGVSGIGLHLRPGAREWFFHWLKNNRPDLVPAYERLYSRGANLPKDYRQALAAKIRTASDRFGLGPSAGQALAGRNGRRESVADQASSGPTGVPGDREASFPRGSLPATREPDAAALDLSEPVLF